MSIAELRKNAKDISDVFETHAEMISFINTHANKITPDHDSTIVKWREITGDPELTLKIITDEQFVILYQLKAPDGVDVIEHNRDVIDSLRRDINNYDAVFHILVNAKMSPLDI